MKTIYAEDVEFNYEGGTGGDGGLSFKGFCPECNYQVIVAEHYWQKSLCDCGLNWKLSIEITAEKEKIKNDTTI